MSGTTRGELRIMIRRRLEDETPGPLWNDQILNDAIAEAIRRYSVRMPREDVASLPVTAGTREIALPDAVANGRVARLFDDRGEIWTAWEATRDSDAFTPLSAATGERMWRIWGGAVLLASPAPRTGTWRAEHLINRTQVAADDVPLDMEPGDEDIHIALAMAAALSRRAIAETKRATGASPMHAAARTAQLDAERLFWLRGRKARNTTVHPTSVLR